ncbi:MAG: hypothetical protein F6K65_15790 [Moorea sp. SIO3C2]|nr:hypothetical protein [Moorena sp. SIO3C2]
MRYTLVFTSSLFPLTSSLSPLPCSLLPAPVLMQSLMAHGSVCGTCVRTCLDAVAHGEGLCAEPASAPCKPRGNPQDRLGALSVGELNSPRVAPLHRSPAPWKPRQSLMGETTAVAHGEGLCAEPASAPCKPRGNPQDRAASPRPRCLPKTALHRCSLKTRNLYLTSRRIAISNLD